MLVAGYRTEPQVISLFMPHFLTTHEFITLLETDGSFVCIRFCYVMFLLLLTVFSKIFSG